jgi:hypothetical protein
MKIKKKHAVPLILQRCKIFLPCLMFVSKAMIIILEWSPAGSWYSKDRLLALPRNIRLGWKWLAMANALA